MSASQGVLGQDLTDGESRKKGQEGNEQTATGGYAFADVVNNGQPFLAQKMVTHSWRNTFTHLLAAIFADALDVEKYDEIARILVQREFGKLTDALQRKSALDVRYWVCAFSVNQHAGICAAPPQTDSTGHRIAPCSCTTPKHFSGDLSEAKLQEIQHAS